jgi:hypothetical protein
MGGRAAKQKGSRREREFAALIGGRRVPLSGGAKQAGAEFGEDVIGPDSTRFECKARANGFSMLYRWLAGADALALKADHKEWLIVLPLEKYLEYLQHQSTR